MKEILVFTSYYLPGYKGGGPIVSLSNMVRKIPSFRFKILTRDHDLNSSPYLNVKRREWTSVGNAIVYYMSKEEMSFKSLKTIINSIKFDIYYFNSFFSIYYTLFPLVLRKLKNLPAKPVILAPRGEFFTGALGLKKYRKKIYLILFKILKLHKKIIWQASNDVEKATILALFTKKAQIIVAPILISSNLNDKNKIPKINKEPGQLNIIFLSRITRKKNLDYALNLLKLLKGSIRFEIYGPVEDKVYWKECNQIIKTLPNNITVIYKGLFRKSDNINIFKNNHVFLFPTKGENFGHVIFESLAKGCPVIISDQTPWKNLQELKVGWDISISNPEKFIAILNGLTKMNNIDYVELSKNATKYGIILGNDQTRIIKNIDLFQFALNKKKKYS